MSILKVQEGQNIFDVVLQSFGNLEEIGQFLTDNPALEINDELSTGQTVEVNPDGLGDEDIKARFIKISFITNNKDGNFTASTQDQKLFQDSETFEFMDGLPFEFN